MSHFFDGGGGGGREPGCFGPDGFADTTGGVALIGGDGDEGGERATTDADVLATGAVTMGSAAVTRAGGLASLCDFPSAPLESQSAMPSAITSAEPPTTASATAARDVCERCLNM